MPSTLPLSSTAGPPPMEDVGADASSSGRPKFVVSQSGRAAHPYDIIAVCRQIEVQVDRLRADAEATLRRFEEDIRNRELAEKRRVAPGWLDSDARLLEPARAPSSAGSAHDDVEGGMAQLSLADRNGGVSEMAAPEHDQGMELDRAFGS